MTAAVMVVDLLYKYRMCAIGLVVLKIFYSKY